MNLLLLLLSDIIFKNPSWECSPLVVPNDASVIKLIWLIAMSSFVSRSTSVIASFRKLMAFASALKSSLGEGWFPATINCIGAHKSGIVVTGMYCANALWLLNCFSLSPLQVLQICRAFACVCGLP